MVQLRNPRLLSVSAILVRLASRLTSDSPRTDCLPPQEDLEHHDALRMEVADLCKEAAGLCGEVADVCMVGAGLCEWVAALGMEAA